MRAWIRKINSAKKLWELGVDRMKRGLEYTLNIPYVYLEYRDYLAISPMFLLVMIR